MKYKSAKSVSLIQSGESYFKELSRLIALSQETLHIQTYIFERDKTGNLILDELEKAAKRNVNVYFLADAYGSKALSNKDIEEINQRGIHFRLFSPFFSKESIYRGRRLHHKLVVADGQYALIGGINIADKYYGKENDPAWLDYAVSIEGQPCVELEELCEHIYHRTRSVPPETGTEEKTETKTETEILIRFTKNDWIKRRNQIHRSYRNALYQSKESVTFIASYFLPGIRFRKALRRARKRGIRVDLILTGKSDLPLLMYAEKYYYSFFLQNGINIYEWDQSVMHGKAVIVDNDWATIGSYNLNPVSHYLSIELNVEIKNEAFVKAFNQHIDTIKKKCKFIHGETASRQVSSFARARNFLFYFFFKLIFMLFISKKN